MTAKVRNKNNSPKKAVIRSIDKASFRDHSNALFLKSRILKLNDLVHFQTAQIIHKAAKTLRGIFQKLFQQGNII